MSALGLGTFAAHKGMSALPPKADITLMRAEIIVRCLEHDRAVAAGSRCATTSRGLDGSGGGVFDIHGTQSVTLSGNRARKTLFIPPSSSL